MARRAQPARPQPTLGQATGGRPGRVPPAPAARAAAPRAPAAAPTPRPPTAGPLGLRLGLNPQQRGAFQQAAQQGQGQQWLAGQRPGLQARAAAPGRAAGVQNFLASGGQIQPPGGGLTPQPPPGNVGMPGGNMAGAVGAGAGGSPFFAGPRGTPTGDQLTPAGIAQMGGNPYQAAMNAGDYLGASRYLPGGGMMPGIPQGPMSLGYGGGGGMGQYGGMQNMGGPAGMYGGGFSPAMNQILQARGMGGGYGGGGMGPWGMAGGSMGQMGGGGTPAFGQLPRGWGSGNMATAAGQQAQASQALQPQQQNQQQAGGGTAV